jgi:5-deoxy-D-glucuronate isomerase
MAILPITNPTCIVGNTGAARGRTLAIAPGQAAVKHLRYGRINLASGDVPIDIDTGGFETGLIALSGEATVMLDGFEYRMQPYDALYIPRQTTLRVTPGNNGCDVAEIAAPVERTYPVQFVSFAAVQQDPALHFETGSNGSRRTLNILLGNNSSPGS